MDTKTLREKTGEALVHELKEAQARLHAVTFQLASNQVKHVREVRNLKKAIARIKTLIQQSSKNNS